MQKIYIRTHAYNAKKTLRRAVDSVLNQTYTNFTYYLCENGSTDGGITSGMIEQYAKLDSRIVPFYNKVNRVWSGGNEAYLDLPHNIDDDDYYCFLDADDEYLPTFFEEMIAFMNKYDLDIACCGSDFISVADSNSLIERRLLHNNLILDGQKFVDMFPLYHVYMRTEWAKMYKGSTLHNTITKPGDCLNYPVAYGGDTFFNTRAFSDAQRVGILAKSLHKYYMSIKSVSYGMHPQRVKCDQILFKDAIDYLNHLEPFRKISQRNLDFLYAAYLNSLIDTVNVLFNAKISNSEKLNGLTEMCTSKYTQQLAAWQNLGLYIGRFSQMQHLRENFFTKIVKWLLALDEIPDKQAESFCNVGEFVCAASEYAGGWIFFQKFRIDYLINQRHTNKAKVKLIELEKLLPNDKDILAFREKLNKSDGSMSIDTVNANLK